MDIGYWILERNRTGEREPEAPSYCCSATAKEKETRAKPNKVLWRLVAGVGSSSRRVLVDLIHQETIGGQWNGVRSVHRSRNIVRLGVLESWYRVQFLEMYPYRSSRAMEIVDQTQAQTQMQMQTRMHLPPVVIFTSGKGPHPLPHLFTVLVLDCAIDQWMWMWMRMAGRTRIELFIDEIPQ